jgi:RNA polymerase sigma-70 factor (ECF subfamily)
VTAKTDAELIRESRASSEAFGEFYRRHVAAVHRFLATRVPGEVAGELTAETFARAFLSLGRFRDLAGGSGRPWLLGIAGNLVGTYFERRRIDSRARERLGMPLTSYDLDLDAANDRIDANRLSVPLETALKALPTHQRTAVELRVVAGLPYRDVAQALGCSEIAARIRVSRALGSLSDQLKGANS